ncbi:MAG: glycosyltransferase, partial [Nitrospirota bacterium]
KHDVHVYAYAGGNSPNCSADIERYGLSGKVFYSTDGREEIPTNKLKRLVKACGILGEFKTKRAWNFLRTLNVAKYGMAAASLSLFYEAAAFMRNGPYDIVHCHFGQTGNIGAMLKEIGVIHGKVITTFYGYDLSEYIQKNGLKAYELLFSRGDVLVAISEIMKDRLIQLGCRKDKVVVHRLGVDMSRFNFSPRRPVKCGELQVLTVGRFVEKKGLEFGIRAVAQLVKEFPGIVYRIIGDGELKDEITQLITRLNVGEHIQLLGWRKPKEVARYMGEADVFLAPSVTSSNGDQEGTPTVIIEALARGVPVLGTFHSGIPELIQDHKSGFLVPERDAEAIAQKLQYLCQHPDICAEMGRVGRDWVEQFHDINKLNDQLVNLYERELRKSPR